MSTPPFQRIGVVGSGAMGRGIAQLFAQSGIAVHLYDNHAGALEAALASVADTFAKLLDKGRISAEAAAAARARLVRAESLAALADCDLVIEAIVERLDVKRELFAQLEAVVADEAVLATNTSSLSVTGIAAACRRPQRVAGLHFFNPCLLYTSDAADE